MNSQIEDMNVKLVDMDLMDFKGQPDQDGKK